jgi:hypothetical protein
MGYKINSFWLYISYAILWQHLGKLCIKNIRFDSTAAKTGVRA